VRVGQLGDDQGDRVTALQSPLLVPVPDARVRVSLLDRIFHSGEVSEGKREAGRERDLQLFELLDALELADQAGSVIPIALGDVTARDVGVGLVDGGDHVRDRETVRLKPVLVYRYPDLTRIAAGHVNLSDAGYLRETIADDVFRDVPHLLSGEIAPQ